MTIDIDELERLEREATEGPWETEHDRNDQPNIYPVGNRDHWIALLPHQCVRSIEVQANADAAFIAALRNAAPDLLAAYRERDALRAEVERLRALVVEAADYVDPIFGAWGQQPEKEWLRAVMPFASWKKVTQHTCVNTAIERGE